MFLPNRKTKYDASKPHISEQPMTLQNWYKHVNWLSTTLIIFLPLAGFISAYWVTLQRNTALFAIAYYFFSGLGA